MLGSGWHVARTAGGHSVLWQAAVIGGRGGGRVHRGGPRFLAARSCFQCVESPHRPFHEARPYHTCH